MLPSSGIGNTYGRLVLTNSQFTFTTAHLCHLIVYTSYASMMQQTERNVYRAICSSSGTTLTVTPPPSLYLSASVYYELVMMPLNINSASCVTTAC